MYESYEEAEDVVPKAKQAPPRADITKPKAAVRATDAGVTKVGSILSPSMVRDN